MRGVTIYEELPSKSYAMLIYIGGVIARMMFCYHTGGSTSGWAYKPVDLKLEYYDFICGGAVVQCLAPQTINLKVGGSSLVSARDKKLYSTLSLSTQVYKWVPATKYWGGNLAMD